MVKTKIFSELVSKKGTNRYEPPEIFREFCISAGATKLFDTILAALTTSRHSEDRINLNKKRVVSFIYNMCYCLSQVCNPLQIDHALYLKRRHINQEGLETKQILGHTCARRTADSIIHTIAQQHYQSFRDFVNDAIELSQVAASPHN